MGLEGLTPQRFCEQIGICGVVVNDHVKASGPPVPPKPPKQQPLAQGSPMECSVCEYVGMALLLGQSPDAACQTAFSSQASTKMDACLAFAAPFGAAMKDAAVADHQKLMELCKREKYC